MSKVRIETTTLDKLAVHVPDEDLERGDALDPERVKVSWSPYATEPPIVDETGDLLDGFHRTAGLVAWARRNELELEDVEVQVVVALHPKHVTLCADGGTRLNKLAVRKVQDLALALVE
jgi:hypothetical protein